MIALDCLFLFLIAVFDEGRGPVHPLLVLLCVQEDFAGEENSVTRLDHFWARFDDKLSKNIAQIFGNFLGYR